MTWLRPTRPGLLRLTPLLALAPIAVCLVADVAEGRVGGGHSYSGGGGGGGSGGGGGGGYGGGGGGSSGGGGDGGEALIFLIRIWIHVCIEYPWFGLPVTGGVVVYMAWNKRSAGSQSLSSRTPTRRRNLVRRRPTPLPWDRLKKHDPDFSRVILLDFLGRLFVRYQLLKGKGELESIRPYLSKRAFGRLEEIREESEEHGRTYSEVVIGSLTVKQIAVDTKGRQSLMVQFDYNVAVTKHEAKTKHRYVVETWQLQRGEGARTPPPDQARALGCPNCGAPVDQAEDGTCAYCDTRIEPGEQSWMVRRISELTNRPRHAFNVGLGGGVEEGTDLPDVVDPGLAQARARFAARHPDFDEARFEDYARAVFLRLQASWSDQTWEGARPYETDQLFHTHRFYLEHLKAKRLVNQLRSVRIGRTRIVRVETDTYYDAITIRIHASGNEFTTDRRGKVVSGSMSRPREFSEYWTFVRSTGYEGKEDQDADHCPNCGGPIEIQMAGECAHCGSTITTGQFGWVLAAIEQDEAYAG